MVGNLAKIRKSYNGLRELEFLYVGVVDSKESWFSAGNC